MDDNTKTDEIVFFCKDCQEIADTERCGKKYVYKCKKCGTKNVAFGTKKSISSFFRLEEGKKDMNPQEAVDQKSKSRAPGQ